MIHKAKDLSPEQRAAVESLIERRILENEVISIRTIWLSSASVKIVLDTSILVRANAASWPRS